MALVFSEDQDLTEAADELRAIAREQRRWIKRRRAAGVGAGHGRAPGAVDRVSPGRAW